MHTIKEIEDSKKYLFHGSSTPGIEMFELRQPYSHGKRDGAPCVAASDLVEPAIFMAVLGSKKLGGWKLDENGDILYYLLRSEFEKAKKEKWSGYVYILNRDRTQFNLYTGWEWRAHQPVEPIGMVQVNMKDQPKNLRLLETQEQYDAMAKE